MFGQYLLIDTGSVVFLFDTNVSFEFNTGLLDHLDNTEHFKWQFLELPKTKDLDAWVANEMTAEGLAEFYYYHNEVRSIGDFYINCFDVRKRKKKVDYLLESFGITYDCSGRSYFVTFVDIGFHDGGRP